MAGELSEPEIPGAVWIVLRDLPLDVRPTIGQISMFDYDDSSTLVELVSGKDTWVIQVDARLALAEQVVAVAGRVQDEIQSDPALRGSTWPGCPAHGGSHPLRPDLRNEAWWICPVDGGAIWKVGSIGVTS